MRRLISAALLAVIAWQGYAAFQRASLARQDPRAPAAESAPRRTLPFADAPARAPAAADAYTCDGRTHCSQMTSCAEATWFINHCPGTEMDGNADGVPCERQWCGQ